MTNICSEFDVSKHFQISRFIRGFGLLSFAV
jgi:hypothetical protein